MSSSKKIVATAVSYLLAGFSLTLCGQVDAQDVTSRVRSARGGILATAEGHQFEVFFYPSGVRVYLLDASGRPVDASGLTGHATFYHPNAPDSPWFSRPLHLDQTTSDHSPVSLELSVGLERAPRKGVEAVFEIVGLQGEASSTAEFKIPVEFVGSRAAKTSATLGSRSPEQLPVASQVVQVSSVSMDTGPTFGTQSVVNPLTYSASTPGGVFTWASYSGNFVDFHRDWTTGRINLPLSKPWLLRSQ
jgi:hypothetical protein